MDAVWDLEAQGWRVRRAGRDAIVVGSGRAFLIVWREVPGRAAIEDGVLTARLHDDDETIVRYPGLRGRVLAAGWRVGRAIKPIVVVDGDFPGGVETDEGLVYVRADLLAEWLQQFALPRVA
jgi:hypothetical protein